MRVLGSEGNSRHSHTAVCPVSDCHQLNLGIHRTVHSHTRSVLLLFALVSTHPELKGRHERHYGFVKVKLLFLVCSKVRLYRAFYWIVSKTAGCTLALAPQMHKSGGYELTLPQTPSGAGLWLDSYDGAGVLKVPPLPICRSPDRQSTTYRLVCATEY